ncbi:MAG: tetratricopeptide repeat protein [Steroidobacteraceae bacterium]
MRWIPLLLAVFLPCLVPAADAPVDERTAAYQQFRSSFDAGDYAAALPLAMRVVELTASSSGADAPELGNPLSNLATTYYRLHQYEPALDTYRRALTVLDMQGDATDTRLLRPLHGMGMVLRALDRGPDAIVPLKRAVDITRNREGLHAASQLPMLNALVDSYIEAGRFDDASRERQFAFGIAETLYGRSDIRMLSAIDDQARWNEQMGRYTAARLLHVRAVDIADAVEPGGVQSVAALRGIARCYRLAYVFGENAEAVGAATLMPSALGEPNLTQVMAAPSSEGERALRHALSLLSGKPGQTALRGQVLLDLGDWYFTDGKTQRAVAAWSESWNEMVRAGDTGPLQQPAVVVYRPPSIAVSRRLEDEDDHSVQEVELRLVIGSNGAVREATVANPAPEREAAERAVMAAVRRSGWRPAFSNGAPVDATNFVFRERVFVKRPKQGG